MTSPVPKGRVLGVDVGRRRIGLAVSDPTGTLASPLLTLTIGDGDPVAAVAVEAARLARDDEGLAGVVVGLPVALDGTATDATREVAAFIDRLRARITVPVVTEDERLTSREAESRLALRERDWRKRKARLDAAAAAIILQDYLDRMSHGR
jgi:putative Holliday junction resolvase